ARVVALRRVDEDRAPGREGTLRGRGERPHGRRRDRLACDRDRNREKIYRQDAKSPRRAPRASWPWRSPWRLGALAAHSGSETPPQLAGGAAGAAAAFAAFAFAAASRALSAA